VPFELKNPLRSKERILIFGHEGTGKSTDFLHIAAAIPSQNFYVVDNDNAYDRLVDTFQQEHDIVLSNLFIAGQDFAQDQDPYSWETGTRTALPKPRN
jgi:energy-coupling factor transporter ATP-binding protein EcfA2